MHSSNNNNNNNNNNNLQNKSYSIPIMPATTKLLASVFKWDNSRDAADNRRRGATGSVRLVRFKEIVFRYVEIFFQVRIPRKFGLVVFEKRSWNVGS